MTVDPKNAVPQASPSSSSSSGTIDITNIVEALRQSFVTWGTAYLLALEISVPYLQWLAFPVISQLNQALTRWLLNQISQSIVMESFFLNTAVRKSSQAQDYLNTLQAKKNLPPNTSPEVYRAAEKAEMDAFRNFVKVSN